MQLSSIIIISFVLFIVLEWGVLRHLKKHISTHYGPKVISSVALYGAAAFLRNVALITAATTGIVVAVMYFFNPAGNVDMKSLNDSLALVRSTRSLIHSVSLGWSIVAMLFITLGIAYYAYRKRKRYTQNHINEQFQAQLKHLQDELEKGTLTDLPPTPEMKEVEDEIQKTRIFLNSLTDQTDNPSVSKLKESALKHLEEMSQLYVVMDIRRRISYKVEPEFDDSELRDESRSEKIWYALFSRGLLNTFRGGSRVFALASLVILIPCLLGINSPGISQALDAKETQIGNLILTVEINDKLTAAQQATLPAAPATKNQSNRDLSSEKQEPEEEDDDYAQSNVNEFISNGARMLRAAHRATLQSSLRLARFQRQYPDTNRAAAVKKDYRKLKGKVDHLSSEIEKKRARINKTSSAEAGANEWKQMEVNLDRLAGDAELDKDLNRIRREVNDFKSKLPSKDSAKVARGHAENAMEQVTRARRELADGISRWKKTLDRIQKGEPAYARSLELYAKIEDLENRFNQRLDRFEKASSTVKKAAADYEKRVVEASRQAQQINEDLNNLSKRTGQLRAQVRETREILDWQKLKSGSSVGKLPDTEIKAIKRFSAAIEREYYAGTVKFGSGDNRAVYNLRSATSRERILQKEATIDPSRGKKLTNGTLQKSDNLSVIDKNLIRTSAKLPTDVPVTNLGKELASDLISGVERSPRLRSSIKSQIPEVLESFKRPSRPQQLFVNLVEQGLSTIDPALAEPFRASSKRYSQVLQARIGNQLAGRGATSTSADFISTIQKTRPPETPEVMKQVATVINPKRVSESVASIPPSMYHSDVTPKQAAKLNKVTQAMLSKRLDQLPPQTRAQIRKSSDAILRISEQRTQHLLQYEDLFRSHAGKAMDDFVTPATRTTADIATNIAPQNRAKVNRTLASVGKSSFRRSRSFVRLRGFSRIGGVLIGHNDRGATVNIKEIEWEFQQPDQQAIRFTFIDHAGVSHKSKWHDTELVRSAMAYAADGHPTTVTMITSDISALRILVHPALIDTAVGYQMIELDRFVDKYTGKERWRTEATKFVRAQLVLYALAARIRYQAMEAVRTAPNPYLPAVSWQESTDGLSALEKIQYRTWLRILKDNIADIDTPERSIYAGKPEYFDAGLIRVLVYNVGKSEDLTSCLNGIYQDTFAKAKTKFRSIIDQAQMLNVSAYIDRDKKIRERMQMLYQQEFSAWVAPAPEFQIWSGVREKEFRGHWDDLILREGETAAPENILNFMEQVAFITPPLKELNNPEYSDENPWQFSAVSKLYSEVVLRKLKGDDLIIIQSASEFTILQRLFRLIFNGKAGLDAPVERLAKCHQELSALYRSNLDQTRHRLRTPRWNAGRLSIDLESDLQSSLDNILLKDNLGNDAVKHFTNYRQLLSEYSAKTTALIKSLNDISLQPSVKRSERLDNIVSDYNMWYADWHSRWNAGAAVFEDNFDFAAAQQDPAEVNKIIEEILHYQLYLSLGIKEDQLESTLVYLKLVDDPLRRFRT